MCYFEDWDGPITAAVGKVPLGANRCLTCCWPVFPVESWEHLSFWPRIWPLIVSYENVDRSCRPGPQVIAPETACQSRHHENLGFSIKKPFRIARNGIVQPGHELAA